jgi:hypothetical protein
MSDDEGADRYDDKTSFSAGIASDSSNSWLQLMLVTLVRLSKSAFKESWWDGAGNGSDGSVGAVRVVDIAEKDVSSA